MEPVRIKLYGFVKRTRQRYLIECAIGFVVLAAMFVGWTLVWPGMSRDIKKMQQTTGTDMRPLMRFVFMVEDWLPLILAALAIYKCLEAFFVLRWFQRKEAE